MDENRMLLDSFNIYYSKGISALEASDLNRAKRNLLLAAESLLKLSKSSTGSLKADRLKRADELIKLAGEINVKLAHSDDSNLKRSTPLDTSKFIGNQNSKNTVQSSEETTGKFSPAKKTGVKLDDIAGLYAAKNEIYQRIIAPQKFPELFEKFKKKSGGGILLYGLPGTGKTMFAQAIATELNATFFEVKSSDIASKWFGDSEQNIRNLFTEARKHKVSVIFFDEFEALGTKRETHSTVMKRLVPELLSQIQGFEKNENTLLIIAATNRPWDIDSAFLRPGRFNTQIYVDLPDDAARKKIISDQLTQVPVSEDLDFNYIVEITNGFNGADVVEFCDKLKDQAIQNSIQNNGVHKPISKDDVELTKEIVFTSVQMDDWNKIQKYRGV
ncbi:ATP-binding protein [Liberiplasma polymorphum]|uniref:ATP-binding protein n=1 Tax=Liberiplasma polymorphum TaxID=3374570 RepID=UPI003773279F